MRWSNSLPSLPCCSPCHPRSPNRPGDREPKPGSLSPVSSSPLGCLGAQDLPACHPHWESVLKRTLCLRASRSPPCSQNKPHPFSLILLANAQNGWVASPRKHVCILIEHQGIFLTCSAWTWRRPRWWKLSAARFTGRGAIWGLADLSELLSCTTCTRAPNVPSSWKSDWVRQRKQCCLYSPGGRQAPSVSPRRPV